MIAVAAHAQGAFTFNTRNLSAGSDVKFTDTSGAFLTGADFFVQVFAGPVGGTLVPLDNPLPLNRTGTGAGYTNPFIRSYTTAMTGNAQIGYAAYQGSSWATATLKSPIVTKHLTSGADLTIALQEAPNLPLETVLGVGTVALIPEPTTLALGLLGLGALLAFRRRQ
jgi:hypothetical protein